MGIFDRLQKSGVLDTATATHATVATDKGKTAVNVAKVATVAVANPHTAKINTLEPGTTRRPENPSTSDTASKASPDNSGDDVLGVIQSAESDGVMLYIDADGSITLHGNPTAIVRWQSLIHARNPEILAALAARRTSWRPSNIFFLRDHVSDGSMDEIYLAFWLAVSFVSMGLPPDVAERSAVAKIRRQREARGRQCRLFA
jgi:hypothetical protein